jgi:hypothetical protein
MFYVTKCSSYRCRNYFFDSRFLPLNQADQKNAGDIWQLANAHVCKRNRFHHRRCNGCLDVYLNFKVTISARCVLFNLFFKIFQKIFLIEIQNEFFLILFNFIFLLYLI